MDYQNSEEYYKLNKILYELIDIAGKYGDHPLTPAINTIRDVIDNRLLFNVPKFFGGYE